MQAMVTSPHPLASQAGRDVVANGGTATEACIAMNAVLCVVSPQFCGLGGDAVWLLSDAEGHSQCLSGIGQALEGGPGLIGVIPHRGPASILTSAAMMRSWEAAHDYWHKSHSFGDLLRPAIRLAAEGYKVTASQNFWQTFRQLESSEWPGFDTVYRQENRIPAVGEIFCQPQLAHTLEQLAVDGPGSFYDGPLSRRINEGLQTVGVKITARDLRETTCRGAPPLQTDYRGLTLLAPPPPTQGLTTLMTMGILNNFKFSTIEPEGALHLHLVIEAIKQAFLDRAEISDQASMRFRSDDFLNAGRLKDKSRQIRETALTWPQKRADADTVFFAAVDGEGKCASVLQSTFYDWGSGVIVGDTGILWHNRGAAFDPDPRHINAYAPGKLPFMTLNPGIALRNGRPYLLYGTQGADGQPQTLALLLTRLIDFGQSVSEALAGGRFLLGRTFSDMSDLLKLEAQFPPGVTEALHERGHGVTVIPNMSPLAGLAGAIRIHDSKKIEGGHDPRGDGVAIAVEDGA